MTGVDKQLEDLHDLVSARLPAEGSSGDKVNETESRQQAAVQQAVRDECSRVEERVRTLEATLAKTADGGRLRKRSGSTESSPIRATEGDRDCRLEGCPQIAREHRYLTRSRSTSPSPTHTQPLSPLPPPPVPGVSDVRKRLNSDTMLRVVEEGTATAQKASELAEEALKVGKEAAERSQRNGEYTGAKGTV